MDWRGHVLTDSGGFQIFSLEPRRSTRTGPTFRSTYDGSRHRLTPEGAVAVQAAARRRHPDGARRVPGPAGRPTGGRGGGRDAPTAGRPGPAPPSWLAERRPATRHQFGIVQGGIDVRPAHRERQRHRRTSTSTATPSAACRWARPATRWCRPWPRPPAELPADRPRYLMGVGDPVGIVEGVAHGVDMFDCVLPTRLARHGTVLTDRRALNLRNAQLRPRRRPARPRLPVPAVRPLLAGLPAPPAAGRRAHRHAPR